MDRRELGVSRPISLVGDVGVVEGVRFFGGIVFFGDHSAVCSLREVLLVRAKAFSGDPTGVVLRLLDSR